MSTRRQKFTIEIEASFYGAARQCKFALGVVEGILNGWAKFFINEHKETIINIHIKDDEYYDNDEM